ncbi:TonB-dependent receptor [Thalassotalea atypica]|uniref:TonB-dependent receptor n=1 Tax=Thalassotalea atypica TaxID=2054316 RepID=UPI0025724A8D|nr:TonB-dependent receptor [Thalassotalea atypica]
MFPFKRSALYCALLSAGVSTYSVQANQDLPQVEAPEDIEVIQVRGIRRSLEASQSIKMDNSSIVEAISAEDIGKLPDVSIAESLARLPGVTAQRLNGRAQNISIRGMSADFSSALFNGREVVSTGDNRGVEFDQFPSELLNGVLVYKTPDASLIGQGLAGTVDMQTIKPLAHGEQTFSVGGRYEWSQDDAVNPLGEDQGERLSATYIDQFLDDTLGLAIGYSHTSTPNQIERFEAWGYPENDQGEHEFGGAKVSNTSNLLERDSVMAIIEFAPNADLHSTLDLFYSEFEEKQNITMMEMGLTWSGAQLQPGYETDENGNVIAGTYDGVKPIVRNDLNTRDSDMFAIGWNTNYNLNDDWSMEFDVAHSKVDRVDMNLETYAGTDGVTDTISYEMTDKGPQFTHDIDYSDPTQIGLTDSAGWGQAGFNKFSYIDDEINQVRLAISRYIDSEVYSNVTFGAHYIERSKEKSADEYIIKGMANGADIYYGAPTSGTVDFDNYGLGEVVVYDPWDLWNSGIYEIEEYQHPDVTEKAWLVEENVLTLYTKLDIDTEISDYVLKGNFGFQAVYTDQFSEALSSDANNNLVSESGGDTYWEFLPSLNLNLNLTDEDVLRLGIARTLSRARMDDLRASGQYSFDPKFENGTDLDGSPWSASGGNPELRPWIANAIDLSYEHYFTDSNGYYAVAVFYKDLENYIYNEQVEHDFTGYPVPDNCTDKNGDLVTCSPEFYEGYSSTPQNGEGGDISGVELSVSLTGEMFTPALEGFGVLLNGSYTDSSIQPDPNNSSTPLPGLSEKVLNTTMYYAQEGFEARVSSRYRSEFLGEVSGWGGGRELKMIQAETIVDAQVSYSFAEGSQFDGLTLLLQGNNLTNEAFEVLEDGDENRIIDYQEYGRTFMFGANYTF